MLLQKPVWLVCSILFLAVYTQPTHSKKLLIVLGDGCVLSFACSPSLKTARDQCAGAVVSGMGIAALRSSKQRISGACSVAYLVGRQVPGNWQHNRHGVRTLHGVHSPMPKSCVALHMQLERCDEHVQRQPACLPSTCSILVSTPVAHACIIQAPDVGPSCLHTS